MKLSELNNRLTISLQDFIKKENHYNTGTLSKSIRFTSTIKPDGDLDIKLKGKEYIQYLDDGKFLDNFYNSSDFLDIIYDWYFDYFNQD